MTNRVSQHTRNSAAAIVAIAFAASGALLAGPAAVQADAYQQVCTDAWDDAPAKAHCSATVTRFLATNPTNAGNCNIVFSSCEISVLQNQPDPDPDEETTVLEAYLWFVLRWSTMIESPTTTDDITLCWSLQDDAYVMELSAETCGTGEIDLSTATSTGLPAIPE